MARVLITLPTDLLMDLDDAAALDRASRSEYIRDAIKAKMKSDGYKYGRPRTEEEIAQYEVKEGEQRVKTPNAVRDRLNRHAMEETTKTAKKTTKNASASKAKKAVKAKDSKAQAAKKTVTAKKAKPPVSKAVSKPAKKATKASPKTRKVLATAKA